MYYIFILIIKNPNLLNLLENVMLYLVQSAVKFMYSPKLHRISIYIICTLFLFRLPGCSFFILSV